MLLLQNYDPKYLNTTKKFSEMNLFHFIQSTEKLE